MGKAFSKIPQTAQEAAMSQLNSHEVHEIALIFQNLAAADGCLDRQAFGEYFAYPGILRAQIFDIFDSNTDGVIDANEFLRGLAMCCRGSMEDKLHFCFSMFDLSGDGYVDRHELKNCLTSTAVASYNLIQAMATDLVGNMADNRENDDVHPTDFEDDIEFMVNEAFDTCDVDHNQKLSIDEFKHFLLQTPEVTAIIYSVFEIRKYVSLDDVAQEFEHGVRTSESIRDKRKQLLALNETISTVVSENMSVNQEITQLREDIIRFKGITRAVV